MTGKEIAAGPPALPAWFTDKVSGPYKAEINSVFVLHGDTTCLVPNPKGSEEPRYPYMPLREMLNRVFENRPLVIFYDIAAGIRFLRPEMEAEFKKVAEIASEEDAPKDVVAAAKAGLAAKRQIPREPELALPLIEKALAKLDNIAVIIEQAHFLVPDSGGNALLAAERTHIARIRAWAQDSRVKRRSNIVILITDLVSKISSELRQTASRIGIVFVPKPSEEERSWYIERLVFGSPDERVVTRKLGRLKKSISKAKGAALAALKAEETGLEAELEKFPPHFVAPKGFDLRAFVNATQGMSLRQILEIFRGAKQAGRDVDLGFARDKKREILNAEYGDVMEVVDPQWGLEEIGGLLKVKAHFNSIIAAIRRGELRSVPQGITIMGPPGTGKTALCEALAKGAEFNFVKMKNARSMWVGQSEERTERQIQGLRALAPVVIQNDEADLGEANRDSPKGDSGVSERIMQAWMQFLSDPRIRGKVLMVNCTNRPDRMDAAMKRSGRSDDRIPILMPADDERKAIFAVMFKRYKIPTPLTDFMPYAEMTSGFSGADIESIVLRAFRFAGEGTVDDEALCAAIADFIPSASQADIDLMTLLALSESSSRRLLPDNAAEIVRGISRRKLLAQGPELIRQILARNIVELKEVA